MQDEGYSTIQVGGPRAKKWGVALVDDADAEMVGAHRWYINSNGYAVRQTPRAGGGQRTVLLHRELLGLVPGDGRYVDHVNGDTLDNRRDNLRLCTHAENHQNRHNRPYRGVHWHAKNRRWVAGVMLAGKHHYLGCFDTREEAATVVVAWRRQHMPFSRDAREPLVDAVD